jgi:hypothetical protein
VKGERGAAHGLLTREVKADEGQDLFCDLCAVRCVLPEEVRELRLQLATPRLPCFQVRRAVLNIFGFLTRFARAASYRRRRLTKGPKWELTKIAADFLHCWRRAA